VNGVLQENLQKNFMYEFASHLLMSIPVIPLTIDTT